MKRSLYFTLSLFIVLFLMSSLVYSVDYGYPFYGRFISDDSSPVSNISLYLDFDECRGKDLVTNQNGEFVLILNEPIDIFYKENGLACSSNIEFGSEFYVNIENVENCGNISYGPFLVGSSISPIGTNKIDSCIIDKDLDYISPSTGSSGGGSGGASSSGSRSKDNSFIVLPINEAKEMFDKYEEAKKPYEDRDSININQSQKVKNIDFSAESKLPYLQEVRMNISNQAMYSLLIFAIIILIANMSAIYSYFKALKDSKHSKKKNKQV